MKHDEFSSEQLQELRVVLLEECQNLEILLQSDANQIEELDQSKVGRLSRIDAMQQQKMAAATLQKAAEKLVRYRNVLQMLETETDEFGYCVHCDELIPFRRLRLRPESRICVPCLNKD